MSFADVEDSISKLKDITAARDLRKANEQLREDLECIKQEHKDKLNKQNAEIIKKKMVIEQKEREILELDSIQIKYKKRHYSPKAFDLLVERKFNEKVAVDIENKFTEKWEREEPALIIEALRNELNKYPDFCMPKTRHFIDSTARSQRNILLKNRSLWPTFFQEHYKREVQSGITKGLDEEFIKRAEEGTYKRLSELINVEWPKYIYNIANQFFRRIINEQIKLLQTPISIICDRCGTDYPINLNHQDIANLLKKPAIKISCTTPGCRDLLKPHGILLTLADVILQVEKPCIRFKLSEQRDKNVKTDVALF